MIVRPATVLRRAIARHASAFSSRNTQFLHSSPTRREERVPFDSADIERVTDNVDVCIVGGGPAGLSAAIRLKQLERERGREIRVVVLEKGPEVGAHILSGAVIEPRALNELLPSWSESADNPLTQPATSSSMKFLTSKRAIPIPHPPQMNNKGNYVVSLSQFTAWLGAKAEELGVEVYPGFAGAGVVYSEGREKVLGVRTNEVGIDRHGKMKESFEPGMEFRAKVTLFGEGAHGSLTKGLIRTFSLRSASQAKHQTYGIGLKEVWRVDPSQYRPGEVVHTMGWPLDWKTYGGGWVYHMDGGLVSLGLVIGLDYANPWLSPYQEFQRMKHHPYFTQLLSGNSERLAYGARTLNEGGLQSVPKLHFPGGALIGCSAGFVNVAKIKGTHNAMKSGMVAAEAAFDSITSENASGTEEGDMAKYEDEMKASWVWEDLYEVRNLRPSFNTALGIWGGIAYSGIDSLIFRGRTPWTLQHPMSSDAAHTGIGSNFKPIDYPKPQPPLSTDILTSVSLTGTNHTEDQLVHLQVRGGEEGRRRHITENVGKFAGLLGRACPAGVYEYIDAEAGETQGVAERQKLVINSQNCIHCKLCDIKVPTQDIDWVVPEGGGGPKYSLT